tara:strand:- start:210220 stop:210399 length:180 start_codon:yes stop_codon:yes gene_type:complete
MADTITPTQPLTPPIPVTVPPDDKRREKQKKPPDDNEQEQTDNNTSTEKPHKGLFDEYV